MTARPDQDPAPPTPRTAQGGAPAGGHRQDHLGYVAHEIRNPLSTALWTAELLARLPEVERGGARGEKLANICLRSLGRIRLLVEDHLLCERLDAGGYPVRPEPVLLTEVLAVVQARWPAESGTLSILPAGALTALVDRALLERVLEALVAVAGAGDGPVRVEASASGERLEIRVSGGVPGSLADPGKGAASDQRGRSLALSMARRVATALGGSLAVAGEGYLLAIPAAIPAA